MQGATSPSCGLVLTETKPELIEKGTSNPDREPTKPHS
jgi:hypothetical protein